MPFNIFGEYIPEHSQKNPKKHPVKVRKEKRQNTVVTVILNLPFESKELKEFASMIKKRLGCGGSVKDDVIEIQGDQVESIQEILLEKNIKSQ